MCTLLRGRDDAAEHIQTAPRVLLHEAWQSYSRLTLHPLPCVLSHMQPRRTHQVGGPQKKRRSDPSDPSNAEEGDSDEEHSDEEHSDDEDSDEDGASPSKEHIMNTVRELVASCNTDDIANEISEGRVILLSLLSNLKKCLSRLDTADAATSTLSSAIVAEEKAKLMFLKNLFDTEHLTQVVYEKKAEEVLARLGV